MMDNVVDVSRFPLPQQEREAKAKRRIGLGVTGLADALILCGVRYGSPEAVKLTESWLRRRAARCPISPRPRSPRRRAPSRSSTATPISPARRCKALPDDVRSAIGRTASATRC